MDALATQSTNITVETVQAFRLLASNSGKPPEFTRQVLLSG